MKDFNFNSQRRRQLFELPKWMSWTHSDNQQSSETDGLDIPDHKDWYKEGHVT